MAVNYSGADTFVVSVLSNTVNILKNIQYHGRKILEGDLPNFYLKIEFYKWKSPLVNIQRKA